MSIISRQQSDNSSLLAGRYARLAADQIDSPGTIDSEAAKIPFENLFRMLEMYRYKAYSGENRQGVLAMVIQPDQEALEEQNSSYKELREALNATFREVFDEEENRDQEIQEIQDVLRSFVQNKDINGADVQRVRQFFKTFYEKIYNSE